MKKLLAAALLCCGCFNPDDLFPVRSRLLSASDVSGQRVELLRGEVPTWPGGCPSPRPSKETTADEDGGFTFDVLRAEAQRLTLTGAFCFQAKTRFDSGTETTVTFRNVNGEYDLPPLVDWEPALRLVGSSYRYSTAVPPRLERPGGFADATRAEFVAGDGGLVWARAADVAISLNEGPSTTSVFFSPHELEDFSGTVQVVSRFVFAGIIVSPGQHENVMEELRAGQVVPVQGGVVPFSRGMACPPFEAPCPLTDGALESVDAGGLQRLELRWGTPRPVARVLIRGAALGPHSIVVESLGADGGVDVRVNEAWTPNRWDIPAELWPADEFIPLETQLGEGRTVTLNPRFANVWLGRRQAVGVVLTFGDGGLGAISEVSVFEN